MFTEYFIIIMSAIAITYMIVIFWLKRQDVKLLYKIRKMIMDHDNKAIVNIYDYDEAFQLVAKHDDKDIFIKVVNIRPKHELIITNSHKWGINPHVKNFKRSSNLNFVEKTREFIKLTGSQDKEIMKVAFINPDCHNIVKYLNEADAITVDENNPVDGVYFVKSANFQDFLKKH